MKVYYPATPASDGTSMTPPSNAQFTVHELTDTTFSNPLPLESLAGTNAAPLTTTAQGVLPDVYVISDNYSHVFKSGEWKFRRDSFDGAQVATEQARQESVQAKQAAAESSQAAQAAQRAAETAARAAAGSSTGSSLTPDPENPGLFFVTANGQLAPDPANPGLYQIGV